MPEIVPSLPPDSRSDPDDIAVYQARVGSAIKGKWRLESLLGVGGMAAVYAASHRNGQRAALKVLHKELTEDKAVTERFLREAYVSNQVAHPGCVKILDDDVTEADEPFLVMELLEGETLRELWMRTGRRMPVGPVLRIVDPVLDCLAACHAISVIHRDLKPANVFVCKGGAVKVLDFGVAQFRSATAERTASGTALGTPSYMSPEQAMGLVDQLDGRSDLFSVGALLHALVTGHRINKGRTENEALVMAATTPIPSVARIAPELPVEVVALIDKSLAWDRRNRFESARAMQEAVRAAALGAEGRGRTRSSEGAPLSARGKPAQAPAEADESRRAVTLRDLFRRIDRVLPSVRQMGWEHPATERALRQAFEAIVEALGSDPSAMTVTVRPHAFQRGEHTVWEPAAPFDAIPYNLFSCGVRTLRVEPGVTLEELSSLLTLVLLEPGRDLPPEDDLASALWEKSLPHVGYDVADAFAEGDAASREAFYVESDEVEARARAASRATMGRLEARAMAVSTNRAALGVGRTRSPMALDDVVRAALAVQLVQTSAKWSERYVDVLVDGLLDAARHKDAVPVLASLRRSAADLVVAGRVDVVTELHRAMTERLGERLAREPAQKLGGALTNALFGAETLELMLGRLREEPARVQAFEPVLETLSGRELPTVLAAFRARLPDELAQALLRFVARVLPGHESELAGAAKQVDPQLGCQLLALLAGAGTAAAKEALGVVAKDSNPMVRVEAKALLAESPESREAELTRLAEDPSPVVRRAAIRAIARHQVKGAFAAVARQARAPGFDELPMDERSSLLGALFALSVERAEAVVLELAKKAAVFASEGHERTRLAAILALDEGARSSAVAVALEEIAQARWGTSEEVRSAAAAAAENVGQRAANGGRDVGDRGSSP